ncbi:MBL fold metallo-hydrolase [Mesobacillus selenatarsenatis]|uniref:MBL fold metallo-hydrolase n=1 Tax=Mesobacillus selenatarsenatis TaxID=388741 RepID=A0A846TJM0_9BACI|nr:MBL fold metallo-hydrolase [Mesobacillus selenatarsenatis]NKE04225.1 MBL fold metallo-hydrolase [Mesobacillus selenatarsenatis]
MQTIERIGERFWYMTPVSETDRPILGIVAGSERTLMIDAGNSEAHANLFMKMVNEKGMDLPSYVVLTHWHWDHIFGLSALGKTISISSTKTKKEIEKLRPLSWSNEAIDQRVAEGTEIEFCANAIKQEFPEKRDISITLPVMTFEDEIEIDLGGITCIIKHVGGDHAEDSVVIYVKEEKILFLADSFYPDIFSGKDNYTVDGIRELLNKLEVFDADFYILSHTGILSKQQFDEEVKLLRSIADLTEKYEGVSKVIIDEYRNMAGRDLSEDELETVQFFVNGFDMK